MAHRKEQPMLENTRNVPALHQKNEAQKPQQVLHLVCVVFSFLMGLRKFMLSQWHQ